MADTPITVEHNGITITYNERTDHWDFTLRGRERDAESLAKAKEAIDRPVKLTKDNTFERVTGWYFRYGSMVECTITSLSERRWGGGPNLNISYKNEQGRLDRGKVIPQDVFPRNEKNDAMAAEWRKHADHIKVIREEMEKIKGKMKCYVPPAPEPEEPEKK